MTIMSKYELMTVADAKSPIYLQANGIKINETGDIIFYDVDINGEQEIVYAYSSRYWNSVKLVE